jgi:DNA-binding HxlR family transcriptional regulator
MRVPRRTKSSVETCPVFIASQILGKKWAIIVLQELLTPEAKDGLRFNEIQRDLAWITPKVLSQRLTDLVDEDLVSRTVDASVIPAKVSYRLTGKGEGLRTTIQSMQEWGRRFGGEITADCLGHDFETCHECRSA